ncbi:hypothetical protein M5K25_004559 [Dendrobium thyrsiflorum]|uniref:Uncharacterized protein n=1 Tax=Dendrobium thyrsiflorum TaxID=117978 RepID=A0ABD0VUG9_DENTH
MSGAYSAGNVTGAKYAGKSARGSPILGILAILSHLLSALCPLSSRKSSAAECSPTEAGPFVAVRRRSPPFAALFLAFAAVKGLVVVGLITLERELKMASGEEPNRGLIKTFFNRHSKKGTSSTQPATPTQPVSHTQPATHTTSLPTPPGASSLQCYSGDPRFPSTYPRFPSVDLRFPSLDATQSTPFYPYYPPPPYGGPPAYLHPPYVPPYYPPPPLSLLQVDLRLQLQQSRRQMVEC